jgi:hypothetical protein
MIAQDYARWLDLELQDPVANRAMLAPYPAELMRATRLDAA